MRLKAESVHLRRTQVTVKSPSGFGGVWFLIHPPIPPRSRCHCPHQIASRQQMLIPAALAQDPVPCRHRKRANSKWSVQLCPFGSQGYRIYRASWRTAIPHQPCHRYADDCLSSWPASARQATAHGYHRSGTGGAQPDHHLSFEPKGVAYRLNTGDGSDTNVRPTAKPCRTCAGRSCYLQFDASETA